MELSNGIHYYSVRLLLCLFTNLFRDVSGNYYYAMPSILYRTLHQNLQLFPIEKQKQTYAIELVYASPVTIIT